MHYANVQRLNEADSLIEYDPPANGVAQYNGIADSLSLQPTATRSSSAPPLPYKEGPNSSSKVPEIMQNTLINAPSSIRPYKFPSIVGARSNSLHSSLGSFPSTCYMVHARHGPTPSAAHYPVAQSAITYSTMDPSTVQQVTYPTLQSVSSNVQAIGDDSDPYPLHTAQPSNLLLGGSCGHQTLHSSSTAQPASTQLPYPEDSGALMPAASHLHPAQYPTSTPQTNICYTVEGSAPPSLFNPTPYSPTEVTAGEGTTNPGGTNAPYCQPYQQPYPAVYGVPIGSEGHRTQLTSSCHGQPHTHSPVIHNDSASYHPSAECNRNALSSTGLLGQASYTLPISPSTCKFPTAPAWSSSHSALTISTSASPSHASPTHSVSSGQQEYLMGSHCNVSSNTAHSSTTTSPIAILTPHSDSTAYLSDHRSLSQSEPQSPLSPYVQHTPGPQGSSVSPHYSEYSPVVHQPVAAYKGLPPHLPSTRYDVPDVGGSCAGRSPLLPIYNVAHDRSIPSHNPCHGLSHHQHGIHFTPSFQPISSNPTDPSVTMGYPTLTTPVHPYHDNRSQRCFGACCSNEHDADDSDEPHAYAFIHNARETKKRPRRKFEEIVRNYACSWTGCAKAYGTLNHLNAHITNSGHGSKRDPSEFKELRKLWRKQKHDAEMEELLRNARGRPRGRHEVIKASTSQPE